MRYVAANTTIPVPHVYHYGTTADNPTGLGPFIIIDYIEHHQNMSRELLDPARAAGKRPILDPELGEEKLEFLYSQVAHILLQLSSLMFPRIGSLAEKQGRGSISVMGRPLIMNMNELVVHTNAPASILPSQTYASSDEWYSALAGMHVAQLALQRNDAVEDEADARDKYVARQLFRNLAAERRLVSSRSQAAGSGCFLRTSDRLTSSSTRTSGSSVSSTGGSPTPPRRSSAPTPPGGCSWKSPSTGPAGTARGWRPTSRGSGLFCARWKPKRREWRLKQTLPRRPKAYH